MSSDDSSDTDEYFIDYLSLHGIGLVKVTYF